METMNERLKRTIDDILEDPLILEMRLTNR